MAFKPVAPTYLDADPNVALANAQQARDFNSLNAWLKARQQLIGLSARIGNQRLDRQQGLTFQGIVNNLAARGLGRSGDVGYQQGQAALDFADKRYDQNAGYLGQLSDLTGNYLADKQKIRGNTTSAYQNAFAAAGENPVRPAFAPAAPAARPRKPVAPVRPSKTSAYRPL